MNRSSGSRTYGLLACVGLSLVGLNFGFDIWRRYDFDAERKAVTAQIEGVREDMEEGRAFAAMNYAGREQLTGRLDGLDETLLALSEAVDALSTRPAESASQAESAPQVMLDMTVAENESTRLGQLLDAPLESLAEELWSLDEKPYLLDRLESLPTDPRKWRAEEILRTFEDEFQVALEEGDRQIVTAGIEAYRQATVSTHSRYLMELNSSLADRVANGEYERLDPKTGRFPSNESVGRENMAVFLIGKNRVRWRKEDYPSLHRLLLLGNVCL